MCGHTAGVVRGGYGGAGVTRQAFQRQIALLKYRQGMSIKQIALELGLPRSYVRTWVLGAGRQESDPE